MIGPQLEPDDTALRVFIEGDGALAILLPASEGGELLYFTPEQTEQIGEVLLAARPLWDR